MRIFVTGASGFVGREFCLAALTRGHEVLGLHRDASIKLANGCQSAVGSLSNPPWKEIESFSPDAALHLAWIATPGVYLDSPENAILTEQSEALFHGMIERGVRHIAGTGTCIEYAASSAPLLEDTAPIAPLFPYSCAKVETCQRLKMLSEEAGTSWTWLRLFYPYGAGEHPNRMPTALMRKLAAGDEIELKTPGSVKDYIHVADVADAILAALEHRLAGPVNIGTGTGTQIHELAESIASICGVDAGLIKMAATPAVDPFPITIADTTKLQNTGWCQKLSLEDGLQQLWRSLQIK